MRSENSKIYKETVEKLSWLINGTHIFNGEHHTMPDYRKSVDRFALQALDDIYLPIKKKRLKAVSLSEFLYNRFASPEFYSRYKFCLNNAPVPINVRYPKIFNLVITGYLNSVNNGVKTFDDLSQQDHYNLSQVANKLGYFCKNHNQKLDSTMAGSYDRIVRAFIEASKSFVKHDLTRFDTGLLTRKWVWEKFPNYLDQKGYLVSKQPFSIYNYS